MWNARNIMLSKCVFYYVQVYYFIDTYLLIANWIAVKKISKCQITENFENEDLQIQGLVMNVIF
jgi:hypothetical protein